MGNTGLLTRLWRYVDRTVASWFFSDQWVLLIATDAHYRSLKWSQFRRLVPPPDRYWADPFVIERDNRYHVFIEEKLSTRNGRIACLTLDKARNVLSSHTVLDRPYHLSYPFVFDYDDQLYLVPESAANRTVELYRCVRFPDKWEFVKNLIEGIHATDPTLVEHGGRWWMFTAEQSATGSSRSTLSLYYADSPLSTTWTPHPKNPVVRNLATARPAGRIFEDGGTLIRPSQDSSRRYGYAINFSEIVTLSTTEYEERTVARFTPPPLTRVVGTHTWNTAGDCQVSDAVIRRRKSSRQPTS